MRAFECCRGANLFPSFIEYLKTTDKADEDKKREALVAELKVITPLPLLPLAIYKIGPSFSAGPACTVEVMMGTKTLFTYDLLVFQ